MPLHLIEGDGFQIKFIFKEPIGSQKNKSASNQKLT